MARIRYRASGYDVRTRSRKAKLADLAALRRNPPKASPSVVPTITARTVFVWPRMGLRCGIAEYVNHLVAVADDATSCKSTKDVLHAEHVVLVLMPSLEEPMPTLTRFIQRVRREGGRVTLDIHHMTVGQNPFAPLLPIANDAIWHLPQIPRLAGGGRYVPLPVPVLVPRDTSPMSGDHSMRGAHLGGLTHFGLGHVSKRIPVMAEVARALNTRLYIYGDRNREHVPPGLSSFVSCVDGYPAEHELTRLLRQHDVGLIGRAPWSSQKQLNGSASARFLIGAGVPSVVDLAPAHEDLRGVLDVAPFSDLEQVVVAVRRLLEPGYRSEAVGRMKRYAEATSPRKVAEQMNVAVRP